MVSGDGLGFDDAPATDDFGDTTAPPVCSDALLTEVRRNVARDASAARLRSFQDECIRLGKLANDGRVDKSAAADLLEEVATANGLRGEHGDDLIAHMMSSAFRGDRVLVGLNGKGVDDPAHTHAREKSGREDPTAKVMRIAAEWAEGHPFTPWRRDAAGIPPRQFLDLERHYCRGAVGVTVAAGGRAKTTRGIYEAISMVLGRDLGTGEALPEGPLQVWLLNGEEDQDEIDRRIAAPLQHYGITPNDLGGRLFVDSVRATPLRFAIMSRSGPVLNEALVTAMAKVIEQNGIDVLMIDPLVSFHGVDESLNMHMDLVVKEGFGAIAGKTRCACELFHHPGKPKAGQAETAVEDARGASAVIWAARSARTLNFMTQEEAAKLGIAESERRSYIRIANGKANMGPIGSAKWMRLVVENLANGDEVACSTSWKPPDPFAGVTTADIEVAQRLARGGASRAHAQSPQWFGYALATHLNIPVSYGADNDPKDVARLKQILGVWLKNKVLAVEERQDEGRKTRQFIVPGPFNAITIGNGYSDEEVALQ